jgi:hypothetical protein
MRIFRLENEEGVGPFSKKYFKHTEHEDFYNQYYWPLVEEFYVKHHLPNLKEDGLCHESLNLTGCLSEKDFHHWFSQDLLVALEVMGFTVNEYEISSDFVKVGQSKKQVIFSSDHAKWIKEKSIETFLKDSKKIKLKKLSI